MMLNYGSYTLTGTVDECIDFIKKFDCSYTVTSNSGTLNDNFTHELNKDNITISKENKKEGNIEVLK